MNKIGDEMNIESKTFPQMKFVSYRLAFTVINALIYASIYAIIGFYNWLLIPVYISNIAIAILVAILIEHSFQLLGIGFKNIILNQEISGPIIIQEEI